MKGGFFTLDKIMKTKFTILALCACSIALLPAQTTAPEKSASEETAEMAAPKAETPLEEQAFKIFDIVGSIPKILGSIKDEASFTSAEEKIEQLLKQIKVEETALQKHEVPDNDARTKLSAKLKIKEKAMNQEMLPVMASMQQLDPAIMAKLGPLIQKFGAHMQESEPTLSKYFSTDEEQEKLKK